MYRVERCVGRLVEIAIWSPVSLEEAQRWGWDHDQVIDAIEGPYVCFVDLRGARVFPPEVVDAYVSTMRSEDLLERTATLLPESALVAMQISRMIREANHPGRRAFQEASELRAWLGELLRPAEDERLGELLARAPDGQTPPT